MRSRMLWNCVAALQAMVCYAARNRMLSSASGPVAFPDKLRRMDESGIPSIPVSGRFCLDKVGVTIPSRQEWLPLSKA